ncbi:hypothetical protein BC831DRAFT_44779 [Entophlyctis helioformis]|nr:hypothetical protein BC831DRAFT_44779 [Entophlyctis helioformis]
MTHRPLASLPSLSAAHAPSPRPTLSLSALLALCLIVTASTPTLASPSPPAPVAPITQPQVAKVASGLNTRSNTIARAAQGKPPGIASVDWQAVGDSITLVGNFTRLSLAADGPPLDFSVPENHVLMLSQTASQTPSNSSRVRVIGTYPTTSIVAEACLLTDPVAGGSTKLVLGGRLTAVSGTPVSNVFAFNVDTGLIDPLAGGLSGPVSALACINSPSLPPSLWVSSAAGSNAPVAGFAAGRLGEFGGNVALWAGDGWVPLPGKGLGGPVTDIKSDSQGTVYFAGAFRETADGSWSVPPSSQMTSLFVGNVIAPGRLALVALACPNNRNNGWFTDTPTSVLISSSAHPLRFRPSHSRTSLTRTTVSRHSGNSCFLFLSLYRTAHLTHFHCRVSSPAVAPGKHYTLIQTNAAGQPVATCVECTLPKDEDIHMYYVATPELTPQTNDILVEVLDSYRVTGTGLASVQIFQREIVVYANAGFNPPFGCSGSAVLSRSLLVGPAWSILSPTAPTVVFATSSRATLDTSYAAFYPSIPTAGLYRVTAHIPPCVANSTAITACTGRGVLTFYVYASTTGGVVPRPATALGTVRIDSRSATPLIAQLGSFNLTSTAVVVLSGVSNGNHVFIDSVHFTKLATQSGLKYLAKSRTGDASGGSGGSGGWTAHPFTPLDAAPLPDGSVVLALAVTSNDTLFVGGRMTASATMTHLIKYAPGSSVSGWMALSNGGLNDQVTHLATLGTLVIAGGAFTATGDGVTVLRRLAVYDSVADTWASVGFGLSRPPLS